MFSNRHVRNDRIFGPIEPLVTCIERRPAKMDCGLENIDFRSGTTHELAIGLIHTFRMVLAGTIQRDPEGREATQAAFFAWVALSGSVGSRADVACVKGVWLL